jgi:hypothetical protein
MTAPAARVQDGPGPREARPLAPRTELRALLSKPGSRTILLDGSRDPNSGVTMLVTPSGADGPQLAVKVATTAAAADVIEREARLLAGLEQRPLPQVGPTLPRHWGTFDADGLLAVASSVVPGVPMRISYHAFRHLARPDSVRADFGAAESWLAALHADTMAQAAPITLLDGIPERIAARWPGDRKADEVAGQLGRLAPRLASASTPRTVVHGDFWAGNLLVTEGKVTGVVDWAGAELSGEPLRDIARFALSYCLYLDRHTRPGRRVAGHPGLRAGRWGAGLSYGLAGAGWFGLLVRGFVEGALTRLCAPAALWRDVLLAGLGEVAVTADHPDFAVRHRDLLWELICEVPR